MGEYIKIASDRILMARHCTCISMKLSKQKLEFNKYCEIMQTCPVRDLPNMSESPKWLTIGTESEQRMLKVR